MQGNGTHCDDIDECSHVGGEDGHHCTLEHGRCINLPGTYTCACDDGYKMDSTNTTCLPVDSCLEGRVAPKIFEEFLGLVNESIIKEVC